MRWHYKEIEKRKGVRYNDCRSVTNPPTKNRKVSLLGTGGNKKRTSKRQLPIRKHREERENGIASAVPFSHFSIDAVTFDISKAPMPL